ncbi:MAG: 4-(cytidine 5'-diphospho)-2-C-methyl-D-erythritol kinase [Rhizobiaceae bacterium]
MIERIAPAKVNLALHVIGQRDDGYHLLDSLVVFTSIGDTIRIEKSRNTDALIEVSANGPFSHFVPNGDGNLVKQVASRLYETEKQAGRTPEPVSITLVKNLPVASGIGGGSADAAATLLGLKEFWGIQADLKPIATAIGADVAMCLHSRPLRAQGIGEIITPLSQDKPFNLVLVNPGVEVSTPEVFNALADKNNAPLAEVEIDRLPGIQGMTGMRNDLQNAALSIRPEIGNVLSSIGETDALFARMSGSGATCFGIYATFSEATAACADIGSRNPQWWCIATRTTVS